MLSSKDRRKVQGSLEEEEGDGLTVRFELTRMATSIPGTLKPSSTRETAEGMRALQCAPYALVAQQRAMERIFAIPGPLMDKPVVLKRMRSHRRHVLGVAIARKRLITCSADGLCRVFAKTADGDGFEQTLKYEDHFDAVLGCVVVDDTRVVTWSRDCSAKLWNYLTGQTLLTFSHAKPVKSAFVASGMLFTFSLPQTLSIFTLNGGFLCRQIDDFVKLASPLVVSLPYLICGTFGAQLYVYELSNEPKLHPFALSGHSRAILAVAAGEDADNRWVLSGSEDRTAILFDLEQRKALMTLRGHTEAILSCSLSSKLRRGMTCSADKTSRIWDLETGACMMAMLCSDSVTAGAFDSTLAFCGCADNSAILFDVSRGGIEGIVALIKGTACTEANRDSVLKGVPIEIIQKVKEFLL